MVRCWIGYIFFDGGSRNLYYYMPNIEGREVEIGMEVDRTFNPLRMKISEDSRELGVAVSPVSFLKIMPKDGVGFYKWEIWGGGEIPGWLGGKEKRFRWTGMRASLPIRMAQSAERGAQGKDDKDGMIRMDESLRDGWVVFLLCSHPDVGDEAVGVKIWGDGDLLREIEFRDHGWRKVEFKGDELEGVEVITFQVSRTWNPKRMGVSGDGRDLGVVVAGP